MRIPRLSPDTHLIMGQIEDPRPGFNRSRSWSYTRQEVADGILERLCGMRADWMIVVGDYNQEQLDTVFKPFMLAATESEIREAQRTGQPPKTHPVIYHVPSLTLLCPIPTHG